MLTIAQANIQAVKRVAIALGELNRDVIFVGGAVVFLYIDDPSSQDTRPTKDVDFTMRIASLSKLEALRESLRNKGFRQSHEDSVICRFRYDDLKIDVMATIPIGWAPGNPWFEAGFSRSIINNLDSVEVNLLSLPYFLATKFSAFFDRGSSDPRTSQDFEDIVYLLDNTSTLKAQIIDAPDDVKPFLNECFTKVLESDIMHEAIIGNLALESQMFRFNRILQTLKEITNAID